MNEQVAVVGDNWQSRYKAGTEVHVPSAVGGGEKMYLREDRFRASERSMGSRQTAWDVLVVC